MKHVTIIGGGITGVASAYYLQKLAREKNLPIEYTLMEESGRLGGKVITDTVNDFIIEGGPDSFIVDKPWCLKLCQEVGLGDQLIPSNELQKKVYILRKGKCVPFPSGFRLTIPTEFGPFVTTPLISPFGKLRMAMDYLIPPRMDNSDESLGQFIRRRFGKEALERFAGPLMAGIFVSDPEKLSIMSTFPRFAEMEREFGSLMKAARHVRKLPRPAHQPQAAGNAMFNTLKGGMQSLITAMEKRLEGDIRLNSPAVGLKHRDGKFEVQLKGSTSYLSTDAVILALPAYHAARLVQHLNPELAGKLNAIRYVSTSTVSVAYLKSDLPANLTLDGFGVLIPPGEKRKIIACTWASTKFKHRAPADCVLLRAFIGGYRDESLAEKPDDELMTIVREDLDGIFGISADPILHRIYRWPKGNPQYDVGHLDRVNEIHALAATVPGLHLAGSAFRGIGMPDCVRNAENTVDVILGEIS